MVTTTLLAELLGALDRFDRDSAATNDHSRELVRVRRESADLARSIESAIAQRQEAELLDATTEALRERLADRTEPISLDEACSIVGVYSRPGQIRVATAMSQLGWRSTQLGHGADEKPGFRKTL